MRNRMIYGLSAVTLFAIVIGTITTVSSSRAVGDPPKMPVTADAEQVLNGLDPVLLAQGQEVKGQQQYMVVRKGFRYQFSTDANKAAFEKQPEKYEVQFDGHCAGSPTVKGDPSVFAVHKGKIYLFFCSMCREGFLKEPDKYALPAPRKLVVVFLHDGVELLDFAGPGEVFAAADGGRAFKVVTVAADPRPITSQGFLKVTPNYSFADCPKPDLVVIPGGATPIALKDPRTVEWVKKVSADAEVVVSVCTGAFILGEAGLLDGKEATTHWSSIERLQKAYPKVKVHSDKRYVDNGKFVTAAGVSAGIDASLHVVEKMLGKEAADTTAKYMEYRPSETKNEK